MKVISRLLAKASSASDLLSEHLALAGGMIIVGLMLIISVATISRYFFGQALAWATEISGYSLLYVTFLAGPWLARKNAHVTVDILPNALPERGRVMVNIFASLASFVISSLLAWYSFHSSYQAYVEGEVVANILRTPKYLLLGMICVGTLLMAINFLKNAVQHLKAIAKQ